jgi:hypothetical protein
MFPILKLVFRHPEIALINLAEQHVGLTNNEIALRKAHGRGTIAAATALVKHEWSVFSA